MKCGMTTHSAKETEQQKEQYGGRGWGVGGARGVGERQ